MSNNCDKGYLSLYFFGILAAYAILGLVILVPGLGLLAVPTTLLLIAIVLVVIVVLLFAAAIILKGLSKLFHKY